MNNFVAKHSSMESIDFQKGSMFFKELTLAFTELQKVKDQKKLKVETAGDLVHDIIKEHTGLNIYLDIDEHEPCVEIPGLNKNNILINSEMKSFVNSRDGIRMIKDAKTVLKGTVDLMNSKVTGIFTQMKTTMHLPVHMFMSDKYLPEEIAAITLHETGHIFTYCEFMSNSTTNNFVLLGVCKALESATSVKEKETIFTVAKNEINLKDIDPEALSKMDNKTAEMVVLSNVIKETKSISGANFYDQNAWEYLCDQFAARHGAGRYLVTALEKIFRNYGNISFRSGPSYVFFEALKLMLAMLTILAAMYLPGVINVLGMLTLFLFSRDGDGHSSYDRPIARLNRIRHQIIENLKDKSLTKEEINALTSDLDLIDSTLKNGEDKRQLISILLDFVIPTFSKRKSEVELQKELEELAANELFVKAANFKQLA